MSLARMFGATGVAVFGLILFAGLASAEWVGIDSGKIDQNVRVTILDSNTQKTVVKYEVSGVERTPVLINGVEYASITIPETSLLDRRGMPATPKLGRNFMVTASSDPTVRILEIDEVEMAFGTPVPSKGTIPRNVDPNTVPYVFDKFYDNGGIYPENVIKTGAPFIFRSVKGLPLEFHPVRYNANTGLTKVVRTLVVEITTPTPDNRDFEVFEEPRENDQAFLNLYRNSLTNYEQFMEVVTSTRYDFIVEAGRVLVITHSDFVDSIAPYVAWKKQTGLDVKVITVETGAVAADIKNIVQTEYDTNRVGYVILVGDAEFVPYHEGTSGNASGNEADPMYVLVSGDDNYPDLFISRFSGKTDADVENMVARTINYEKTPDNGDWYAKGVGIASSEGSPTDAERAEELRTMMEAWHYTAVDQFYDPGATSASVTNALNEGRGFINYIGHGSKTSWGTTGFSNSNIDALSNGNRLPFIVSVACVNGDFGAGEDTFAERWLKAGTTAEPKGAIAVYASSTNQSWVPPTVGQKEIVRILTEDMATTIGGLFFNGVVAVLEDGSSSADQTYETWHIFGDATLQVRTRAPTAISAEIPEAILLGQDRLALDVGEAGIRAGVVQNGALIGTAISDASGALEVAFGTSAEVGDILVTLTGFNKTPVIKEVNVIPPNGPYLGFSAFKFNDRPSSDVFIGENISLGFALENIGTSATTAGTIAIQSLEGPAVVMTETAALPAIAAGGNAVVAGSVAIHVNEEARAGDAIKMKLLWTLDEGASSNVTVTMKVVRAHIEVLSVDFGQAGLEGINPGETGNVYVTLLNTGSETLTSGVLAAQGAGCISAISGDLTIDSLAPATSMRIETPLSVTVDAACANGDTVAIDLLGSYQSAVQSVDIEATTSFYAGAIMTHEFEYADIGLAIPDSAGFVSHVVDVSGTHAIEEISIEVNITHTYVGDLIVRLVHPDGTAVVLHNRTGAGNDNITQVYGSGGMAVAGLENLKGLQGDGQWKIEVSDNAAQDTGTLEYVKVTIQSF